MKNYNNTVRQRRREIHIISQNTWNISEHMQEMLHWFPMKEWTQFKIRCYFDTLQWLALHQNTPKSFVFQLRVNLIADHYALLPVGVYRFLASAHRCKIIELSYALDLYL